jgi:hypothetical protein
VNLKRVVELRWCAVVCSLVCVRACGGRTRGCVGGRCKVQGARSSKVQTDRAVLRTIIAAGSFAVR